MNFAVRFGPRDTTHTHPDPRTRRTLEGPVLVLAEAEQLDCRIATIYVTRYTSPELLGRLQKSAAGAFPIVEISATELRSIAGGRPHGGVVAVLDRRRPRRRLERALWSILRLAVPNDARSPRA